MNAGYLLDKIAASFIKCRLDAVLIGNAAAALQGVPVTTMDFDFLIRLTKINFRKIGIIATILKADVLVIRENEVIRLINENEGLVIDFIDENYPPGIKSLSSLKSRADRLVLNNGEVMVAGLGDIMKSKKALGRPKDLAVMELLKGTLDEKKKAIQPSKKDTVRQGFGPGR